MNYANLIQNITENIKTNGSQAITAQVLQDVLVDMVGELGQSGALLGGVIDTSFVPDPTNDAQVVYIAESPGTYTNFNGLVVGAGEVAFFYFDGNAWAKSSVDVLEVVNSLNSTATDKALSAAMGKQLQDSLTQAVQDLTTAIGNKADRQTTEQALNTLQNQINDKADTTYVNSQLATKADTASVNAALALKADTSAVNAALATKADTSALAAKADKVVGAVAGNMAGLDADGNLVDSGINSSAVGDVANKIDRVADAVEGNVPAFDSIGGIEDSGIPADNVAEQDGYYETMVVGGAENLIGSDIVSSQFTRRKTGGSADVGTGVAILKTIKGNTLVWNQLVTTWSNTQTSLSVTATFSTDGTISLSGTASGGTATFSVPGLGNYSDFVQGHKYLLRGCPAGGANSTYSIRYNNNGYGETGNGAIVVAGSGGSGYLNRAPIIAIASGVDATGLVFKPMLIDLTQMFGAGNEPSTVAEFEALFPLNYYAYNTGSLLNLTATGLQTNGFNQLGLDRTAETPADSGATTQRNFDEGKYYIGLAYNNVVRSAYVAEQSVTSESVTVKNSGNNNYYGLAFPFKCFPSTAYYLHIESITGGTIAISYYDGEGNFISTAGTVSNNSVITTVANARWMMVCLYPSSNGGTGVFTKPNINLSDVNKNGTYEPYWTETKALPITTATSGGVAIFSDGMKSAGMAYDEMTATKATKRIGVVNLGSLAWRNFEVSSGVFVFYTNASDIKANGYINVKCSKYATRQDVNYSGGQWNLNDKEIGGAYSNGAIFIKDSAYYSYTTAQFKTAMNGIYAYFELPTHEEYTLDTPFNTQYKVDNDGTETILPENTSTPTTSPIVADINYALNAIDTIRNLPQNYISKASMDAILTAFKTAGVITNYTLTWDATNQKYNCTITA